MHLLKFLRVAVHTELYRHVRVYVSTYIIHAVLYMFVDVSSILNIV